MTLDSNTQADINNDIQNTPLPSASQIPFTLFDRRDRKTTKLASQEADTILKGQRKWYNFSLSQPLFISKIIIHTTGYASHNKVELSYISKKHSIDDTCSCQINEDKFTFHPNTFVEDFSFRPEKRYFGEQSIEKIEIFGFTPASFIKACKDLARIDSYKEKTIEDINQKIQQADKKKVEAESARQEKENIEEATTELKVQQADLEDQLEELNRKISSAKEKVDQLKQEEANTAARQQELDDSIDQKTNTQRELNSEISKKITTLSELEDNINLFPSEISGFVEQGARSIGRYTLLAAIPLIALFAVTLALFLNAADLTVLYKEPEGIDIFSILVTRLPYVAIAAAIIHACYKLAKIFISEIIKINKQRLNLSKISIIATDISNASSQGLTLNNQEKYHLRTQLKMELLREHLKEYIREDYQYPIESAAEKQSKAAKQVEHASVEEEEPSS